VALTLGESLIRSCIHPRGGS